MARRAALRLIRRRQRQGGRDEACVSLAPIYGWFAEGIDTADLHEAKALLEDLSACSCLPVGGPLMTEPVRMGVIGVSQMGGLHARPMA